MLGLKNFSDEYERKHNTREALKGILHKYIERHDTKELAARTGIEYPTLMRKLNQFDHQDIHACELVDFMEATKYTWKNADKRKNEALDLTLLDEIEYRLGRVFSYEAAQTRWDVSYHGLSRLIKESSEATRTLSEAFHDGKVTPEEAENCIKELRDLVHISMRLIKHLEKIELSGEHFALEMS